MKRFALVLLVCSLSAAAFAQNAPLPTSTFSFNASPMSLPGNRGTFVGTDLGMTFNPTPNFDFQSHNLLSSDGKLSSFLAGAHYNLPALSLKANNLMPTVSGFRLLFGVSALVGVDRVKDLAGNTRQHYAGMALATLAYSFNTAGTWQFGANVGMARLPGYATGWTPVVEAGPKFGF